MPTPGKCWRHVVLNTKCSWLHGDARGFRSRDHRVHSSGDYKHRPPVDEHARLRDHHAARSGPAVVLPETILSTVGLALAAHLESLGHRVLVVAVADQHAHLLAELPDHRPAVRHLVGLAKREASKAITAVLPGSIWSAGGEFKRVRDASHQRNAFHYILTGQGPNAWSRGFLREPAIRPERLTRPDAGDAESA